MTSPEAFSSSLQIISHLNGPKFEHTASVAFVLTALVLGTIWLVIYMGEALKKSRAMVVLVSPDSMRSENVRHEIGYALGDPNYEGRVFPVQVRPTDDIPWILRRFKSFDARESAAKVSESIANALKQVA